MLVVRIVETSSIQVMLLIVLCFASSNIKTVQGQFRGGRRVGRISSTTNIENVSGLAASQRNDGLLWLVSSRSPSQEEEGEGGGESPLIYGINQLGDHVVTYELHHLIGSPIQHDSDGGFADIAVNPGPNSDKDKDDGRGRRRHNYIYLLDAGTTTEMNVDGVFEQNLRVYRVREPRQSAWGVPSNSANGNSTMMIRPLRGVDTITLTIPLLPTLSSSSDLNNSDIGNDDDDKEEDEDNHEKIINAQALLVDHASGELIICAKENNNNNNNNNPPQQILYSTPPKTTSTPGSPVVVLQPKGFSSLEGSSDNDLMQAIAGDISHDGAEILLKSSRAVHYYPNYHSNDRGNIQSKESEVLAEEWRFNILPYQDPGQAIAFDNNDNGFYTIREDGGSLILYYYGRLGSNSTANNNDDSDVYNGDSTSFSFTIDHQAPSATPDTTHETTNENPTGYSGIVTSFDVGSSSHDLQQEDSNNNIHQPTSLASPQEGPVDNTIDMSINLTTDPDSDDPPLPTNPPTIAQRENVISIDLPPNPLPADNVISINLPLNPLPAENVISINLPPNPPPAENVISINLPPNSPAKSPRPPTLAPTPWRPPKDEPFIPGLMTHMEHGLLLSSGLNARIIAKEGAPVVYHDGFHSEDKFHVRPDFGATFEDTREWNVGGWVYVSNSEGEGSEQGGVGSIVFDHEGNVIKYEKLLTGTEWNCGGGKTPWNTWISCEETPDGKVWQVDPMNALWPAAIDMGDFDDLGWWESFAFDDGDKSHPQFFVTEDSPDGALVRLRPHREVVHWHPKEKAWNMLHGD